MVADQNVGPHRDRAEPLRRGNLGVEKLRCLGKYFGGEADPATLERL